MLYPIQQLKGVHDDSDSHKNSATFSLLQISILAPCSNPGSPAKGAMQGNNFRHNSWVTFSCDRHHQRSGKERIKCNDGSWSGSVPVCIGEETKFYASCTSKIISEVQSYEWIMSKLMVYSLNQFSQSFICPGLPFIITVLNQKN